MYNLFSHSLCVITASDFCDSKQISNYMVDPLDCTKSIRCVTGGIYQQGTPCKTGEIYNGTTCTANSTCMLVTSKYNNYLL